MSWTRAGLRLTKDELFRGGGGGGGGGGPAAAVAAAAITRTRLSIAADLRGRSAGLRRGSSHHHLTRPVTRGLIPGLAWLGLAGWLAGWLGVCVCVYVCAMHEHSKLIPGSPGSSAPDNDVP